MCGRYASFRQAQELADIFSVDVISPVAQQLDASWNVAPTRVSRIIREEVMDGELVRILDVAQWGLVPFWAKDPSIGSRMINARSETITEKTSFKGPVKYSRCIVPIEGYYEWQAQSSTRTKKPHFIHRADDAPLALAGLTSVWHDELLTFTIATRPAHGDLALIHEREPAFLPYEAVDAWLNPAMQDPNEAQAILKLRDTGSAVVAYEVSTAVNSPRNNHPDLVDPVD